MMHSVRVATKEQLKELLAWIFFRDDEEFTDICESTEWQFEDVCRILDINQNDMIDPALEVDSDEWYDVLDNLDDEDLKKFIFEDEKIPLLQDFKPGILSWALEDDFDRLGNFSTRVFLYIPEEELTFESFQEWRKVKQAEHLERVALYDRFKRISTDS